MNMELIQAPRSFSRQLKLMLDIGGEGRYDEAWNLNPSSFKTRGPNRGAPIPRLIRGRAEAIPLADNSVDVIVVERTPLSPAALFEIKRVIFADAIIVLRHAMPPICDPHRRAYEVLPGRIRRRQIFVCGQWVQESVFLCGQNSDREACRRGHQGLLAAYRCARSYPTV